MARNVKLAVALMAALAASSASATTINLPAVNTATGNAPTPTTLSLAPGAYTATVISGLYSGWNAATTNSQFYPTGTPSAAPGYFTEEFTITNGSVTTDVYGIHGSGATPAGNAGPKYDSSAAALAAAAASPYTFTVTSAAPTVSFVVPDGLYADNTGGVSLSISAVPEPATWALMILGFGIVGFALRRRRSVTSNIAYAA